MLTKENMVTDITNFNFNLQRSSHHFVMIIIVMANDVTTRSIIHNRPHDEGGPYLKRLNNNFNDP